MVTKKLCGVCEHYEELEQFRGMKVTGLCKNVNDRRQYDKGFRIVSVLDSCERFVNKVKKIRAIQKKLFDMSAVEVSTF